MVEAFALRTNSALRWAIHPLRDGNSSPRAVRRLKATATVVLSLRDKGARPSRLLQSASRRLFRLPDSTTILALVRRAKCFRPDAENCRREARAPQLCDSASLRFDQSGLVQPDR